MPAMPLDSSRLRVGISENRLFSLWKCSTLDGRSPSAAARFMALNWAVRQRAPMGLCVTLTLLITVTPIWTAAGSLCSTKVDSLDLGCLLRWDCPGASPNAAYTVQTKTQGDPWKDVAWCVWISSQSCDLSQAFFHFDLYNMIRLGLRDDVTDGSPTTTAWSEPVKFDYSDFAFSAPSVSLYLDGDRLSVRVQFPCAANRRCSRGICCPLSELIDPWTSVTVYNQLNPSDYKRRTVWSQEVESDVQFSGLVPGQHYCAVANFSFPSYTIAASPPSAPRCVFTDPPAGLQPLLVGVSLCFVVMAPILILFLLNSKRQAATASPENRPKAQVSAQGTLTHTPLPSSLPNDPCDLDPCDLDPCNFEPCDLDPRDLDPRDLEPCDLDLCDVHLELIDCDGLI
ncbi:uncharacterized protein si:dkeyp-75h12.7 [Gadus macrocephalus]|uniref:uncharacterized protein si:dkeyp-75h12.7 n=1 Tax=Gadus macrocephalus TaxID=80720 RepID=UPI0028CB6C9F|nr:uncharacterized protein si:dkeyp-75h12.7 [Gadus macrocephalus]